VPHDLGATIDVWDQQRTVALIARMPSVSRVLTSQPDGGYDYSCRMMSVPAWLSDDAIPNAVPYLSANAAQVAGWRGRIAHAAGERKKIGLVWAGNPQHYLDVYRSAPLAALEPLASVRGLAWFALQNARRKRSLTGSRIAGRSARSVNC
jgi:hypothetical protein